MKEEIKLYPDPKLKFIKEGEAYYAIMQNEIYNGVVCEELLYCGIYHTSKGWELRWEDKYVESHRFEDLEDAQQCVAFTYKEHTPHINGKTWEIDED